mgnify:CR=1 FL=1|tara:strand:- start:4889 stop:6409 length:1521 start_codon:yes stop_codon:yes gene_type:complete
MLILILGCQHKEESQPLNIRLSDTPTSLDWQQATDVVSRSIILNIMEPLIDYRFDKKQYYLEPAIVSKWSANKDYKSWDIYLRKGILWSDGVELQAQHIYDSFHRLLDPKTGAPNAFLFYVLQNAKEFNAGKIKDFKKVGISIQSPYHIRFHLDQAAVYFPKLLALYSVMPIRKDIIEKHPKTWLEPKNFVGIGPYLLKSAKLESSIQVVKNPNYFFEKAKIRELNFIVVKEDATALNLYESGDLDFLSKIPLNSLASLKKRDDFHRSEDLAIEYLGFNVRHAAVNTPLKRKAIAQSIDRRQIEKIFQGEVRENPSFLPHGILGHSSEQDISFQPIKKQELFDKNKKLTLSYYTDHQQKRLMENLQQQLEQNLGLAVHLDNMEWKYYLSKINSNPPSIFRIGWMAIFPDPALFLGLYTSESNFNTSGWQNKEYDLLFQQMNAAADPGKRADLAQKAVTILTEKEVAAIPLYTGVRHYLVRPGLEKAPVNSMNRLRFHKSYWQNSKH